MDNGSERELVRRMLGGDEGAFDEFFADYFPRLFRFAVLRLRDPDAAEDIVQTSLIAGVRHLWMDATHSVSQQQGRSSANFTWVASTVLTVVGTALALILCATQASANARPKLDGIGRFTRIRAAMNTRP